MHYSFVGTPVSSGVLIRGEPSPVPMCPSGRILARPERARMRLLSLKGGPIDWRNFDKAGELRRQYKKCRSSLPPTYRAKIAAAADHGEIGCSPGDCPECGICRQAPGSSPSANSDSGRSEEHTS